MTTEAQRIVAKIKGWGNVATPTLDGAPLTAIRVNPETEDCLFVYRGGATKSLWAGCADHGMTMFIDATTNEVLCFARVSSDTAFDLGIPMHDEAILAKMGLKVVERIQDLPDAARADCIGATADIDGIKRAATLAAAGRVRYVHPDEQARVRAPLAKRMSAIADRLAAGF